MPTQNLPWQPFIDRELRLRIDPVIDHIAADLREFVQKKHDFGPSLAGGDAGIALFFHYLAQARPGSGHRRLAEAVLDQAIDGIAKHELWFDLYSGVTGVAWAIQHIAGGAEVDEALAEVEDALVQVLDRKDWPWLHDLIGGLAGMGMYAMERFPRGRSPELLEHVVRHLLDLKETTEQGVTWFTGPDIVPEVQKEEHPDGYYNLGAAHGNPAIVAVLAGAALRGIQPEAARAAALSGSEWILAQQMAEEGRPRFPTVIEPGGKVNRSRLAWCYGDGGVTGALYEVGRRLGDHSLRDRSLELALHSCGITRDKSGVMDAPLCHGAAGLAHIYGRLYQQSGLAELADACRFWLEATLEFFSPEKGIGGFQMAYGEKWEDSPGFLEGSAGVGLALLAATTAVEPHWDRLLAISLPD